MTWFMSHDRKWSEVEKIYSHTKNQQKHTKVMRYVVSGVGMSAGGRVENSDYAYTYKSDLLLVIHLVPVRSKVRSSGQCVRIAQTLNKPV